LGQQRQTSARHGGSLEKEAAIDAIVTIGALSHESSPWVGRGVSVNLSDSINTENRFLCRNPSNLTDGRSTFEQTAPTPQSDTPSLNNGEVSWMAHVASSLAFFEVALCIAGGKRPECR
jgi:hypothetical protein